MTALYNEIDPYAAQWLRNLIEAGHIAPGVVDERDVWDLTPKDLDGYTQVHLFAGIGAWSHALRAAGWPDDRPVWTASCPCQPFSSAGARQGFADERHAWPAVLWLVQARRPGAIFGEQVSSKDGLKWFDVVLSDLDGEGYTVGSLDSCAAGVGAPHIRQRLYFVADDDRAGRSVERESGLQRRESGDHAHGRGGLADSKVERFNGKQVAPFLRASPGKGERSVQGPKDVRDLGGLAYAVREGREGVREGWARCPQQGGRSEPSSGGGLGDPDGSAARQHAGVVHGDEGEREERRAQGAHGTQRPSADRTLWANPDWVHCDDPAGARWRPVEGGTFPLAPRAPGDVGRLRAYGNALCAGQAAAFISAYLDVTEHAA